MEIRIDPEFESLIPPLRNEELYQLEENILKDGRLLSPIIVWDGIIIDGHNRYKILQKHPDIPCVYSDRSFKDREEAIAWICNNQLGRRNLSDLQRTLLLGKRYEAEKKTLGASDGFRGNAYTGAVKPQDEDSVNGKTSERIAAEVGVSKSTVERAGDYVKALKIAESYDPDIEKDIMAGKIKPSKQDVIAIAKAQPKDRPAMIEALRIPKPELTEEEKAKRRREKAERRERMKSIEYLSAKHADIHREPVSTESHLQSFIWTAERFLGTCDSFFEIAPELITDEKFRACIVVTGRKFTEYFKRIEENKYKPFCDETDTELPPNIADPIPKTAESDTEKEEQGIA